MPTNPLYEERRRSTAIVIILAAVTTILAFASIAVFRFGTNEDRAIAWELGLLTALLAVLAFWFRHIDIRLTDEGVRVSYGPFSRSLDWKDVVTSEHAHIPWYWGYGIRLALYMGRWIFVFNVLSGPGVVFLTKNNKPRGLYVSTLHPDQIVAIAQAKNADNTTSATLTTRPSAPPSFP